MKKTLIALLLILIFIFSACSAGDTVTTDTDTPDSVVSDETTNGDTTQEITEETEAETTMPVLSVPKEPVVISFVGMGDNVTLQNAYKQVTDVIKEEFLPDYLKAGGGEQNG